MYDVSLYSGITKTKRGTEGFLKMYRDFRIVGPAESI